MTLPTLTPDERATLAAPVLTLSQYAARLRQHAADHPDDHHDHDQPRHAHDHLHHHAHHCIHARNRDDHQTFAGVQELSSVRKDG
jgi:hypothetical protein